MTAIATAPQRRDTTRRYGLQLRDGLGNPVKVSGKESLVARIWLGDAGEILAYPIAEWFDPDTGILRITVEPADLLDVPAGTANVALNIGAQPWDGFTGTIQLTDPPTPPIPRLPSAIAEDRIFADIRDRIAATGLFEDVRINVPGLDVYDVPAVHIDDYQRDWDYTWIETGVREVQGKFRVIIYAPKDIPQDEAPAFRALPVAVEGALRGVSLAGVTKPYATEITRGLADPGFKEIPGSMQALVMEGTFAYEFNAATGMTGVTGGDGTGTGSGDGTGGEPPGGYDPNAPPIIYGDGLYGDGLYAVPEGYVPPTDGSIGSGSTSSGPDVAIGFDPDAPTTVYGDGFYGDGTYAVPE